MPYKRELQAGPLVDHAGLRRHAFRQQAQEFSPAVPPEARRDALHIPLLENSGIPHAACLIQFLKNSKKQDQKP